MQSLREREHDLRIGGPGPSCAAHGRRMPGQRAIDRNLNLDRVRDDRLVCLLVLLLGEPEPDLVSPLIDHARRHRPQRPQAEEQLRVEHRGPVIVGGPGHGAIESVEAAWERVEHRGDPVGVYVAEPVDGVLRATVRVDGVGTNERTASGSPAETLIL